MTAWVTVHDGSAPLEWMNRLLAWTFHQSGSPGTLWRVWTSGEQPTPFPGETFTTRHYAQHDTDWYPPYNRVYGLRDWLVTGPVDPDDTVVVLEHDMVFLDSWDPVAKPGVLQGNGDWDYLSEWPHLDPEWRDRHCSRPDLLGGAGVPFVATAADLTTIHTELGDRTERIRADRTGQRDPWVAEMYAVVFAAADAGIVSDTTWLTKHFGHDHPAGPLSLLHYGWGYTHPGGWHFDKRTYVPWADPGPVPADAPESVHELAGRLQVFRETHDGIG